MQVALALVMAGVALAACANNEATTRIRDVGPGATVTVNQHLDAKASAEIAPNVAVGVGPNASAGVHDEKP